MLKKKLKVLVSAINRPQQSIISLSMASLYLRSTIFADKNLKRSTEIKLREFLLTDKDEKIIDFVQEYKPDVIGLSCYVWSLKKILNIISVIKERNKKVIIVLGGPEVSPLAEDILRKNKAVDFVVRGEGEITFKELIGKLSSNKIDYNQVEGISYRQGNKIISTKNRELIADLNRIPTPFTSKFKDMKGEIFAIETQRGCNYKCHFCYYHKNFPSLRHFSMNRVKADLSYLLKKKLKRIYLMDAVFNSDMKRAKEILRFIIKNNKNKISFNTEIKAELIDAEMAGLLKKAKIDQLEVGLQSSNPDILKGINRRLNSKGFKRGIRHLLENDLNFHVQLIFGLPGQTWKSYKESVEYVLKLNPPNINMFHLMILPGTRLWNESNELGISFQKHPEHYVLETKYLSKKDFEKFKIYGHVITTIVKTRLPKLLCKDLGIGYFDLMEEWEASFKKTGFFKMFKKNSYEIVETFREFLKKKIKKEIKDINLAFYSSLLEKEFSSLTKKPVCKL